MSETLQRRWLMALIGLLGGACLYGLIEVLDREVLDERLTLPLIALVATLFGSGLVMIGPMRPGRAALSAVGLAVVTAVLVWLASLRFETADGFFYSALPTLAALVVASLPVPFLIAQAGPGWRDYPTLFLEAWSIVVRYAAAWGFTGVVWLVIFLSDALLSIVGVTVIAALLDIEVVPYLVTGAVLGLTMAVVYELADLLSPYLVLRLFRLLLPVVLAVMLVFLVALPFRGLSGLFNGWSPALVLLAMVAAGISLVAVTIDQTDEEAAQSPFLRLAARGQALILPVMAGFGGWAVWLRVVQYGWTPDRVFVALVAVVAVVYGLIYAGAVLRGGPWMARIRRGNLWMALAAIALAALWLSPVLNAERISARDQLARFEAGTTPVEALDVDAIGRWGRPGADVIAVLEERAKAPGQEALAARLANPWAPVAVEGAAREAQLAELVAVMPLQPPTATAMRDVLLMALAAPDISLWTDACKRVLEDGRAGCVMVVADLLPLRPGEEGLVVLNLEGDYVQVLGLYLADDGTLAQRSVVQPDGRYPAGPQALALLRTLQDRLPAVSPALLNQLGTGEAGVLFLP
jgi:Domain of unknown function (DUF4153)